jgi:uncharacterized MnhB-related membrane protein
MTESITYLILCLAAGVLAYRAMLAKRLLSSTLYLACVSALTSIMMYLLGAVEVAVIELSVGAGLVTVLLVYALSVVGEDALDPASIIPKPFAFLLVALAAGLILWMVYPMSQRPAFTFTPVLSQVLWQRRVIDVWIQIALIFSGVMGVLGLLAEKPAAKHEEKKEIKA